MLAVIAKGDNEYITASADKTIRAWRGNCIAATLMGHTDVVRDLALLDGSRLASCSNDGILLFCIFFWEVGSSNSPFAHLRALPANLPALYRRHRRRVRRRVSRVFLPHAEC